jgi:hypothetical protein
MRHIDFIFENIFSTMDRTRLFISDILNMFKSNPRPKWVIWTVDYISAYEASELVWLLRMHGLRVGIPTLGVCTDVLDQYRPYPAIGRFRKYKIGKIVIY